MVTKKLYFTDSYIFDKRNFSTYGEMGEDTAESRNSKTLAHNVKEVREGITYECTEDMIDFEVEAKVYEIKRATFVDETADNADEFNPLCADMVEGTDIVMYRFVACLADDTILFNNNNLIGMVDEYCFI